MQFRPTVLTLSLFVGLVACTAQDQTANTSPDSDGDGLSDAAEAALGTDPADHDTDRDNFDDGVELDEGTDPLFEYSRPYAGGYNIGACTTAPETTGATGLTSVTTTGGVSTWGVYDKGDIVDNFTMVDQYGEDVSLYSFCGQTTMLVLGKGSCGACSKTSDSLQAIQDEWAGKGLQIVEILASTADHTEATVADLDQYAGKHELDTVPVLSMPAEAWDDLGSVFWQFERDLAFPTIAWIGPDMNVLAIDTLDTDPASFID